MIDIKHIYGDRVYVFSSPGLWANVSGSGQRLSPIDLSGYAGAVVCFEGSFSTNQSDFDMIIAAYDDSNSTDPFYQMAFGADEGAVQHRACFVVKGRSSVVLGIRNDDEGGKISSARISYRPWGVQAA